MSDKDVFDRRSPLEWLNDMCRYSAYVFHARKIQDMLEEPRLPKEPTSEAIAAMRRAVIAAPISDSGDPVIVRAAYHALYAELTRPKTKLHWAVSMNGFGTVHFDTLSAAMDAVHWETKSGRAVTVKQEEVPA